MGLGAAKHHEGSRGLTGIGVFPQISKGQGMPGSGMHEPSVQGAARELLRDVPGAPRRAAPCCRYMPSPVGLSPLHCEGTQPQSWFSAPLTGSGVRRQPQPDGVAAVCPRQREHSSVLALEMGTWGLVPLP